MFCLHSLSSAQNHSLPRFVLGADFIFGLHTGVLLGNICGLFLVFGDQDNYTITRVFLYGALPAVSS